MYLRVLYFLFLVGCETGTNQGAAPSLKSDSAVVVAPRPSHKTSKALLIRNMGNQGVVLGSVGANINPWDDVLDDRENQNLLRKSIMANSALIPLVTTRTKPVSSVKLTGRSRVECGALIVELSGESEDEVYILDGENLRPRSVEGIASTKVLSRLKEEFKKVDLSVDLFEADLNGDKLKEQIALVSDNNETPDVSFISVIRAGTPSGSAPVRIGDTASKVGYQKGAHLIEDSALDSPHQVSLLGIADIDGNGSLDLVVLHSDPGAHFHKLVVYEWVGKLKPILDYTWGENDCNPDFEDWPKETKP